MIYRKDITEFLKTIDSKRFKNKEFKFYEDNGLLYEANYEYGTNRLTHYTFYSLLWHETDKIIREEIEKKFNVKFPEPNTIIVCKCGKSNEFSAYYGSYEIFLRCSCGNDFSAYSG